MRQALEKFFGFGNFRTPQEEIISSILSGRDTLAIMPTGGGKSLCYQLPAVMLDGVALVVSPLIALMKDQADALRARGISAVMINSAQTRSQQAEALRALSEGRVSLAYVAPERFRSKSFVEALKGIKISLFAVDEAHCISQWGHDFRPDYMRLGGSLRSLGSPACAAFTATATPDVKEDIIRQLGMRSPAVFVSGFARPNLSMNIRRVRSKAEKEPRLRCLIEKYRTGIVYCSTRKSVEELSAKLWSDGIRHVVYHGGMDVSAREAAQDSFVGGRENVAVATNAFGMGIDRRDIRFVGHYELPGSVEAYYQEAGRAGRDGNPAYCEMLLMYSDKRVQEFFIDGSNPSAETIRATYSVLRDGAGASGESFMAIEQVSDIVSGLLRSARRRAHVGNRRSGGGVPQASAMAVSSAISTLARLGLIERFDAPGLRVRGTRLLYPQISAGEISIPEDMLALKRLRDENKLRRLISFAYSPKCRQQWILDYFGEPGASPCGICDNCAAAGSAGPALPPKLSDGELTVIKKALSGIVRLSRRIGGRKWEPRFGREKILKSLCGGRDSKMSALGLDKLSTYGILKEYGKKYVSELLDALEESGLASTFIEGEYPLFGISDAGVEVLFGGNLPAGIKMPDFASVAFIGKRRGKLAEGNGSVAKAGSKPAKPAKPAKIARAGRIGKPAETKEDLDPESRRLYELLAKERSRLSIARKVRPYKIFSNSVLLEIARSRPLTSAEALEIKGVGISKLRTYIPYFLKIVEDFDDS